MVWLCMFEGCRVWRGVSDPGVLGSVVCLQDLSALLAVLFGVGECVQNRGSACAGWSRFGSSWLERFMQVCMPVAWLAEHLAGAGSSSCVLVCVLQQHVGQKAVL